MQGRCLRGMTEKCCLGCKISIDIARIGTTDNGIQSDIAIAHGAGMSRTAEKINPLGWRRFPKPNPQVESDRAALQHADHMQQRFVHWGDDSQCLAQ